MTSSEPKFSEDVDLNRESAEPLGKLKSTALPPSTKRLTEGHNRRVLTMDWMIVALIVHESSKTIVGGREQKWDCVKSIQEKNDESRVA